MSKNTFCVHCGAPLAPDNEFCPKCGKSVTGLAQQQAVQKSPTGRRVAGIPAWIIIGVLIIIILVVPVIPRHRTVYVAGSTQVVTQTTSFGTTFQTITTNTQNQIQVYKGSISWVSDQYYNYYQQDYYNCYYDQYGNYYCNYTYWPNYNSQYTGSATIDPSDQVIKVESTNEASGLITLTLTHLDGTQDTYRHVISEDLTKGAVITVTGTATLTNTVTNSVVNPVTNTVPCQNCVAQDTVEYVSILGLLLGY